MTFRGSGLTGSPRLIAPFAFRVEESAEVDEKTGTWMVRLTVDPQTAVGVYPIRILTGAGLSNPLLFAVGQVPQVPEAESNDTFETAQEVSTPLVIDGECPGNDVDFYRFSGRAGERIVIDALCARIGSGLDPAIRLTTAGRRLVASEDDSPGLFTDARMTAVLPEDGAYVLEVHDASYEGGGGAGYRILLGAVPVAGEIHPITLPRGQSVAVALRGGTLSQEGLFAVRTPSDPTTAMFYPRIPARRLDDPAWADSELDVELPLPVPLVSALVVVEPNDPAQGLPPLSPPLTFVGRLSEPGERDELTIRGRSGSPFEARVEAFRLGSALDGQLQALARDGKSLGEADDGKPRRGRRDPSRDGSSDLIDPALDVEIPEGQERVKLVVKDLINRGGVGYTYRVDIEPASTFRLAFEDEQINIPRGGTGLIPITVTRAGYDGPITLEIADLPAEAGVTVLPGTVPAGQSVGVVGLRASSASTFEVQELQVVGEGGEGQSAVASKKVVFAEQQATGSGFGQSGGLPSHVRPSVSIAAAVAAPGPILLEPEATKIVVPQGATIDVPIRIVRTVEPKGKLTLAALPLPDGLTISDSEIDETATPAAIRITAAKAPLGPVSIGLVARSVSREGRGRRRAQPAAPSPLAGVMLTLEVVRPARLELTSKSIEIRPGSRAELQGQVHRVAPFSREVQVKLDGLPAGVQAEPVAVAADSSEFTMTLEARPDAAPAEAHPSAVVTFKLGDEDYASPPEPLKLILLPAE